MERRPSAELLFRLLLAGCVGAYLLLLTIAAYLPGGLDKRETYLVFLQGWLTIPLLTILVLRAIEAVRLRLFPGVRAFYPVLVAATGAFTVAWITGLHLLSSRSPATPAVAIVTIALLGPAVIGAALASLRVVPDTRAQALATVVLVLAPPLAVIALANFAGSAEQPLPAPVLAPLLVALIFTVAARATRGGAAPRPARLLLDAIVPLVILVVCFDPHLPINPHHQNFYLGPVNDLLHGKSLLVDVDSQYGVGVHYFLAALFAAGVAPLSYQGLTLVNTFLYAALYILIYALARLLLASAVLATLVMGMVLQLDFLSWGDGTTYWALVHPSKGALRFGLPYVVLLAVLMRRRRPQSWWPLLEYATIVLAAVWSLETGVYVAALWTSMVAYEMLPGASGIRAAMRRVLVAALGAATAWGALALYTRLHAGRWPHWEHYLRFLTLYSVDGLSTWPTPAWGPWAPVVAVYAASLAALGLRLVARGFRDHEVVPAAVFSLTVLGIAELFYYFGQSLGGNLLQLSVPAVLVGAYWVRSATRLRDVPAAFGPSVVFSCAAVAAYLLIVNDAAGAGRALWRKIGALARETTATVAAGRPPWQLPELAAVWSRAPTDDRVAEALGLIDRYAPPGSRVVLFSVPELTTETLVLAGRAHVFPLSDTIQVDLEPRARRRAVTFAHGLRPGDVIFALHDPTLLEKPAFAWSSGSVVVGGVQRAILARLCREFDLHEMETSAHGMSAIRLLPHGGGDGSYCAGVR